MISETLDTAKKNNPHLEEYLKEHRDVEFVPSLNEDHFRRDPLNLIYPVGDPIFIHIYVPGKRSHPVYHAIEPRMHENREKYDRIVELMLKLAPMEESYETGDNFEDLLDSLLKRITVQEGGETKLSRLKGKVPVTAKELEIIKYQLIRDIIKNGLVEPLMHDPYIEDIHTVGLNTIHVVHKVFGMLQTNLRFRDEIHLENYLRNLSERLGNPVSDANPIVDAAMPDGSRINIIYSQDISMKGSSFTIRKFTPKPPPITQLVKWGTFSPEIAAYLWLCLESGMSLVVSGETASGKTTSLNSMVSFINFNKKIYSAEDTPEIVVPHPVWQRLLTRETGTGRTLELFDLVKTALRSRPDYIIIGEVRGKEGSAAFQALQTGHAVLTTFHASSITKMIQRFTGDPINVPIRFMDNLNIALFQEIIYMEGRIIRRCSSIQEIIKYSKERDGVLTREIFTWDPAQDRHYFTGRYNSYILEDKVASKMGIGDPRKIYRELDRRADIIRRMTELGYLDYDSMNNTMRAYFERGFAGMPDEVLG
ncbi:MAG: type II/IV secretion system ATPase subunit [Thermoplasmata archaeon]|nr:type II/IV secretion system ATPase subunit [Thermoplasmata archaeon]